MKTKYITIGLALLLFSTALQAQIIERYKVDSPFAKYGHKVYVGTSGDGELLEFHDQDSVVRIGAALYHVWRDTVIGFVFEDEEFEDTSGIGHLPILSVDPKCDRYYRITPYAYCNNNPVKRIDPNGMEFTTTEYINRKGELLFKTDDGLKDIIIVRDADISKLKQKLQEVQDNGTIHNREVNKRELQILGQTPIQYTEEKTKAGGNHEYKIGYKEGYEQAYKGKSTVWSFLKDMIMVGLSGNDSGPKYHQSGLIDGIDNGKADKKNGNIDRLRPLKSLKNNHPLIKSWNTKN